jgi:hypothetical protein
MLLLFLKGILQSIFFPCLKAIGTNWQSISPLGEYYTNKFTGKKHS